MYRKHFRISHDGRNEGHFDQRGVGRLNLTAEHAERGEQHGEKIHNRSKGVTTIRVRSLRYPQTQAWDEVDL